MTPLVILGIKSIFSEAVDLCDENNEEEKYLIDISDKDAYDNDHFLNFTQQPLLKVLTWS